MKKAALAILLTVFTYRGQEAPDTHLKAPVITRSISDRLARASTDERIRLYERMLVDSPGNLQLQAGLTSTYLQKLRESGDSKYLDRASTLVDRMLENDGGNFTALRFQNEIDLQRHDFKAVFERAQGMTKFAASDPGNWGNLGDAAMELGEYEIAGQAYLKMYTLRPNLNSYNRLGYFHFVTGKPDRAIALMKEAIEAGGEQENIAWCWAELGDMYFKTGKLTEAADAYEAATRLFPLLHRALAGRGKVEAANGQIGASIRSYERAQAVVPLVEYAGALEDLYTIAGMANKARDQRELIEAIEKLGRASNEKTNRNLALTLADHDRDLRLALDLIQAEVPVRPDVYTFDAFAWVLFKNGHYSEARAASAKALKLGTPEPKFYYHAAQIARAVGEDQEAQQYFDRLTSLNPKFRPRSTELPLTLR
jgi:tetratricopeptide (TPR) repeat protein